MRKRRQYHELVIPSYGSRRKGWYINLLDHGCIKILSFIWRVVVIMCIVSVKGEIYMNIVPLSKKELFYVQIMSMA